MLTIRKVRNPKQLRAGISWAMALLLPGFRGFFHLVIDHLTTLINRTIISPTGNIVGSPGNSHRPGTL